MKVAFLITAYKDLDHLCRLVNRLAHPDVSFYIHVDRKTVYHLDSLASKFTINARVYMMEPRVEVTWGGPALLNAVLGLMKTAFMHDSFDYYYLISGQDYPLRSVEDMLHQLEIDKNKEFLYCFPLPYEGWGDNGGLDRVEYYWLVDQLGIDISRSFVQDQKMLSDKRVVPLDMTLFGGSLWFTLTQACIAYILEYLADHPSVIDYFQHTLLADEWLIPTLVMNSSFRNEVINDNLRYIDWDTGPEHPRVLCRSDLPRMLCTAAHFARKFDVWRDPTVLNELDKLIHNKRIRI